MTLILVLHGPNLGALGSREPLVYGDGTLAELNAALAAAARDLGAELETLQSDHEGELVARILGAGDSDGIILNPAGFTHSSVAIRDAVLTAGLPVIEVHLSNLHAREPFRRRSVIAGACLGQITGLGVEGYIAALAVLVRRRSGEVG